MAAGGDNVWGGELHDIHAALDAHAVVVIADAAGRITHVNDRFCALSQYSRDELLGQDHRLIDPGHPPQGFFLDLETTVGQGKAWCGEIQHRAKDGSPYWVDTTIFPRLDDAGQPRRYVAIGTDITRRKADETQWRQTAQALEERNKELETIVHAVSHDLRSPLVNVQGFSRQLTRICEAIQDEIGASKDGTVSTAALKGSFEVFIPQALRFLGAGVRKMDALLSGLLRYSRLGRAAMVIRPLDMDALLADAVAAMQFQIDEVRAEVRVEPLPPCLGDGAHLGQAFTNLLDNALKYRDPARPLCVTVTGRVADGQTVYAVADNGLGIAPEFQPAIFEIFRRLDSATAPGEGLGLTIAQRVLEGMQGRIWVESRAGDGSTFFVSLPAGPAPRDESPQEPYPEKSS